MRGFCCIMQREIAIHRARKSEWLAVLLFYVMLVCLFPIAVGNWPKDFVWLAPIIIWIAALVATILAQDSLLRADFKLGIFEHILLGKRSFSFLILAKILTHWLVFALPMILLTPLLAISLSLPYISIIVISCSLVVGTLILSLVGAIGAALTIPLSRGGILLAMLILPLYIPVLTLGSSIGMLSIRGIISMGHIALLLALLIIAILCAPITVATAIKVSLE